MQTDRCVTFPKQHTMKTTNYNGSLSMMTSFLLFRLHTIHTLTLNSSWKFFAMAISQQRPVTLIFILHFLVSTVLSKPKSYIILLNMLCGIVSKFRQGTDCTLLILSCNSPPWRNSKA